MSNVMLGDPYGLYLEKGWHYLEEPLDTIFINNVNDTNIESISKSLTHEYLHAAISKLFDPKESFKINYCLDRIIFIEHKFNADLSEGSNFIAESKKGVKPHLLIIQQELEKNKKRGEKQK